MLNQDFREFIQSLNANGVRYLVVGGYAVAVHVHPRYTKDIDIWIDATDGPSGQGAEVPSGLLIALNSLAVFVTQ